MKATYHILNLDSPPENRASKTSAWEMFSDTVVCSTANDDFTIILAEKNARLGKSNGFTLTYINDITLGISIKHVRIICSSAEHFICHCLWKFLIKKSIINFIPKTSTNIIFGS